MIKIRIAKEETKFGLPKEGLEELLEESSFFKNVKIVGLMGMATFTDDKNQIADEFQTLKTLFDKTKTAYPEMKCLSMGMSGDYEIAIASGSNMIRVGSKIFGARNY